MKTFRILAVAMAAATLVSCDKDKNDDPQPPTVEIYIDATSQTNWHYFSFATGQAVGSAAADEDAAWGARTDWDVAVNRYNIRTNSGAFTTANAQGGVYTFDAATTFASVAAIPAGAVFAADEAITSEGMGGPTTVVRSNATVILFKQNPDGSLVMPPVYLQAPVYLFRTADGAHYYKVRFTQYKNDEGVSGHVKFDMAKIGA
jgi:hypothetical protein